MPSWFAAYGDEKAFGGYAADPGGGFMNHFFARRLHGVWSNILACGRLAIW